MPAYLFDKSICAVTILLDLLFFCTIMRSGGHMSLKSALGLVYAFAMITRDCVRDGILITVAYGLHLSKRVHNR